MVKNGGFFSGDFCDFGGGIFGALRLSKKVESEKTGGEEEITHKLRLDSEAIRMGKTKTMIGAAGTKEGGIAGNI